MSFDCTDQQARLGQVQSLVRAFGILGALRTADDGLTLTEVAKIAQLPRSTTHRLLTTMNALRYVEFDAQSSRWMIGLEAFALGASFMETRDLARLGRPIMRSLMMDAGETVNIAISGAEGVSYVAQVKPMHDQCAAIPTGAPLPMHSTASGKILLSHLDPADFDRFLSAPQLERRTELTIVEKSALIDQCARIRANGYAVDDQEHRLGMRCVAAPLFDRNGRVRAALSITGSLYRLPDQRLARLGRTLATAAERMSDEIGGLLAA
ncbi:IclR family transcriptional regulator [Sphingomonas naphthae]|uniref:IclR family transcriptional regulator n=1 Tax=Sphingomonas naphthae TaxID=1813468 RepID=A0ABY7TLR0_9SPHN|nr:IclR family transcriptional regulator [Sphingomonas naphthae]WCT74150.1 IclR family transcriptional regulator [Sphingomonas naphthae]